MLFSFFKYIEMEHFLKKYSSVPNGFITDFFDIAKEEYNDNDHKIDFNIVIKWLLVRKDQLKRLLVSNFENEYDYIINKVKIMNRNNHGANYVENIMLTPNCFKELCMLSQTAKAKEVRKYFLEVERLIKKYHEDIRTNLLKEIGLLKINQKPKVNIKGGTIYVLTALNTNTTLYKLGKSAGLRGRLNNYNSGNANDVEPLFIVRVNNIDQVENCLKNLLKKYQYRKKKEIYEVNLDIIKQLTKDCDEFSINMEKKINKMEKNIVKQNIDKLKIANDNLFMVIYPDEKNIKQNSIKKSKKKSKKDQKNYNN
jgi:phage anti-repressor protein